MKKILIILFLAVISLAGCSNDNANKSPNNEVTNNTVNSNNVNNTTNNIVEENNVLNQSSTNNNTVIEKVSTTKETEEEISTFSTKVHDKSAGRKKNVDITTSKINGYKVGPGETFSFCDIVGKATPEKGYEKAKVFDAEGNLIEGYGGGNCQVSTTIYNAVKDLSGIEILERHPHNNDVPYIGEGLDAAVSYGSEDLKFKNNNDYTIMINVSSTIDNVSCSIKKVSQ